MYCLNFTESIYNVLILNSNPNPKLQNNKFTEGQLCFSYF